ncbi:MAG: TorF family putative porin [Pseudomonadales bacterium]
MKILTTAAFAAVLSIPIGSALAEVSASGNVALTTDYKFRGISQSDESVALQGGFDLEHSSGFYIGTWGSSVDFDTNGDGFDGSLELDYYGGFGSDIGDSGFSYDVGFLYYDYPGDDDTEGDYWELYASIGWNDLTVGVAYSDDYYGETDEFSYLYADYSFALPGEVSLDLHVGFNMLEENGGFLATDEDGYTDYSIGVTKSFMDVDFSLAYVGTDLDEEDVFDTEWGDGTLIFTLAKSL